jgi:hypothetical protein
MIPVAAWTSPISSRASAHLRSSPGSRSATPRSIARPITAGMTAWALIQTMPKSIPPVRVCH